MVKKALSINFPIERAILSDFSPFEVPITFSNRHFYHFINKYNLKHDGNNFIWRGKLKFITELMLILLGLEQNTKVNVVNIDGNEYSKTAIGFGELPSIPFTFPISHKHNEFRYLSLIHPKGQLMGVEFYRQYKDLITYYSDLSPLSLRSAKRVAGCTYIDSKSLIESFDKEDIGIEMDGQNYENLKSFFVYKKFRNIFEFYESPEHHWCEKRFNSMSKLDVSQCFDSIYTHSIAWAVFKKEYAKKHLSDTKNTFAYKFDQLMQRVNYNETNGILIGPELSRIFAEIILQAIDIDVIKDLREDNYSIKKDFQIFRYVDDYFIFYNDEKIFESIRNTIQINLKKYKLSLNKNKEETFTRPIITPITIAKKKIANLISEKLEYKLDKKIIDNIEIITGSIYVHQASLSTDFKSILSDSGITYTDILNYSLAIIERKVKRILIDYKTLELTDSSSRHLINALVSIVNFSFFIYAVAPKVNSTIKLCRVIQQIILFLKDQKIGIEYQHIVFKCIFDNTCSILEKSSVDNITPIETLYLLVLIRQLGKYYWLDQRTLIKYFNVLEKDGVLEFDKNLNYFSITSLLFYISDKKRYESVRVNLIAHIKSLYNLKKDTLRSESEMVHLSLDLLTCPYLSNTFKNEILSHLGVDKKYFKKIINENDFWFTKWNEFDFAKELDAKLSYNVY